MVRVLLSLLIVTLVATSLRADYLYWYVDSGSYGGGDYNAALLWGGKDGDFAHVSDIEQVPDSFLTPVTAGYSYYIELVNYNAASGDYSSVAKSETLSYTGQAKEFFVSSLDYSIPPVAWGGGSYVATPEPTSGFLLALGASLLALRRKRVRRC